MTDTTTTDRSRGRHAEPRSATVSASALALHLDLSRAYVTKLEGEGVLHRAPDGHGYDLDDSRVAYLRYLRRERRHSPRSEADAELARTKARRLALRVGVQESKLMEVEEALAFVDKLVGGVLRPRLGSLPAAIAGRDLPLRRRIEAAVNDMLEAIADTAAEFARGKQPS